VSATIGVVVPAFRAETTLGDVLRAIPKGVAHVFVVDDASPDAGARAAESLGDPRVRLIRHEANRGVGGAVKTGYRAALDAGCDVIVKMDADGQMDPAHLDELIRPLLLGQAGYAKGNRLRSLEAARAMPRRRLYGNLFLSFATKAVSGYWNLLDPTNGYTAIRADVLRRLDFARLQERYFFETSMLVELHPLRVPVRDVPMSARYQGEPSSLRLLPISFEFGARLLRALLHRLRLEYVVLDFRPASAFALAGLCWPASARCSAAITGIARSWSSARPPPARSWSPRCPSCSGCSSWCRRSCWTSARCATFRRCRRSTDQARRARKRSRT
jgi:glycosyltransferase involved in cell wall biosynthesis